MASVDSDLLLHPDLLSTNVLIQILNERKIKIDGLSSMPRLSLLELFNKFCLPRSQRKPRDSSTRWTDRGSPEHSSRRVADFNESVITSSMNAANMSDYPGNKKPLERDNLICKRIKLTTDSQMTSCVDVRIMQCSKRCEKYSDTDYQPDVKKQKTKITWP